MEEKSPRDEDNRFSHLGAEDLRALESIQHGNVWLRSILCTLARRGVGFRKQYPERSSEILMVLSPLPYYKAGQFLFDLMEWEDFMLDGPPPPVLTTTADAQAFKRLAALLNIIKSYLDGSISQQTKEGTTPEELFRQLLKVEISGLIVDDSQLPPLEAGFYLYNDVILGLYVSGLQSGQSLSSLLPSDKGPSTGESKPES